MELNWQYEAVGDKRTRPTHAALHGKVFPWDHEFWEIFYTPNGFRCRCTVNSMSEREVKREGLEIEKANPYGTLIEPINPVTGEKMPARLLMPVRGFERLKKLRSKSKDVGAQIKDFEKALMKDIESADDFQTWERNLLKNAPKNRKASDFIKNMPEIKGLNMEIIDSSIKNLLQYIDDDLFDKLKKNKCKIEIHNEKDFRAFYQKGTIHIRADDSQATWLHEIGHHIEYEANFQGHSIKWRADKTKKVNGVLMKKRFREIVEPTANYDKDEIFFVDDFWDSYIGEDYGTIATEVVSMGVQELYDLYRKDKSHFALIIGLLTGGIRGNF